MERVCSGGKKLYTVLKIVVLAMGFFSGDLTAMAAETDVGEAAIVRVAVMDYPNFLQMNGDGSVSGYAYEYLQKIQKAIGWQYEFVEMTLSEASTALENGDVDLVAGNIYTDERARLWDYADKDMGDGGTVLCVLPGNDKYSFNDFAAYDGLKIAALTGSVRMDETAKKLAQYGVSAQFIEYDTDEASKEALQNGDVDAIMMSSIRCEESYKLLARIGTAPIYFCTNKQRPELKQAMDAALEEIHLASPYYEATLYDKYYGDIPLQIAYTKEEQAYIASAGEIIVAVSPDLAPVEYYDEVSNTYKGIVVDSFKIFEAYSGLKFSFVSRQDEETLSGQLASGKVQMIASVADDPAIAQKWQVNLTGSYYDNNITLVANDEVENYTNENCDMILRTGYPLLMQLAVTGGYSHIQYADSFSDCIEMVNRGDADVTLIPSNCVNILADKENYNHLASYTLPDSTSEFSVGIAEAADPLLLSIMNKAIDSFTKEQRTEVLIRNLKTGADTVTIKSFIAAHRWQVMGGVLAISLILTMAAAYFAIARSKMNKKLWTALAQADAANKAKSDFLARMSHDMRTPMNGILGLTYLIEAQSDPKVIAKYIVQMRESGAYLLQLINDVLDVNRVEIGKIELHPEPCDEELLFRSMIELIQPQMDQKKIEFHFTKKNIVWTYMMLDEQRVKQIFINLLTNAVKFTPEGGRIDLEMELVSETKDMIRDKFIVRDNGIGMSPEFLPKIYEPFAQEKRDKSDLPGGTGLGLPIVKHLVALMGGEITVKSQLNKGTEITIYLNFPLAQKPVEKVAENTVIDENTQRLLDGIHVLLCEDHPLNAQIATKLLEKEGAVVTWAENGRIGTEKFSESPERTYDVILMDIRMPEMNGLEASKMIRGMKRADATLPIIAMTANAFEEDIEASKMAGINAHLTKPVNPNLLYQTITMWINK